MSVLETAPVKKPTRKSFDPLLWAPVNRLEALLEVICDRLADMSFLENDDDRQKSDQALILAQLGREVAADLATQVGVR